MSAGLALPERVFAHGFLYNRGEKMSKSVGNVIDPFDLINAFARVEARYDCVWSRACGLIPNVNTYGDRAEQLPKRLSDSRRTGYHDNQFTGQVRKLHDIPIEFLPYRIGPSGGTPNL